MNRFLGSANRRVSLSSAAILLSGSAFLGTVLGILRTKLINANFNNFESDAYCAAFKIPDFVFTRHTSGLVLLADAVVQYMKHGHVSVRSSLPSCSCGSSFLAGFVSYRSRV